MLVCKGLENERMQRGKGGEEIGKWEVARGQGKCHDARGWGHVRMQGDGKMP